MKIRVGFVSNSSSSSFLIAVDKKKEDVCTHCGRRDPNILDLIDRNNYGDSDSTQIESNGIDSVDRWFKNERGEKLNIDKKYYDKDKYHVAYIKISYHDEVVNSLYNELVKNGKIIELTRSE